MMDVISAAAILWNTWNEFEMIELDKDTQSFFSLLWKMFHSVCPVPPLMPRSWVERSTDFFFDVGDFGTTEKEFTQKTHAHL